MPKTFERASISPNDDGTFAVSITPVPKKEKGENETGISYGRDKTYSAASLDEAVSKISGFGGETTPEEDVEAFASPKRKKAPSAEEKQVEAQE